MSVFTNTLISDLIFSKSFLFFLRNCFSKQTTPSVAYVSSTQIEYFLSKWKPENLSGNVKIQTEIISFACHTGDNNGLNAIREHSINQTVRTLPFDHCRLKTTLSLLPRRHTKHRSLQFLKIFRGIISETTSLWFCGK